MEAEAPPPLPLPRVPGHSDPPAIDGAARTIAAAPPAAGKKAMHWLLEGAFIVVSVMLGFAVTRYGEYRDERDLAARMLASIQTEVEYNRAVLERYVPIHRAWHQAVDGVDPANGTESAIDVLFSKQPELPPDFTTNVPLLRQAAWDTALSTAALRLIDYDLAAALSEIYSMQGYAAATFTRLFSEPQMFDPAGRSAALRMAKVTLREMTWAEETLLGLYDKHLPAIRAAGR
jgi:hypothetical protein